MLQQLQDECDDYLDSLSCANETKPGNPLSQALLGKHLLSIHPQVNQQILLMILPPTYTPLWVMLSKVILAVSDAEESSLPFAPFFGIVGP